MMMDPEKKSGISKQKPLKMIAKFFNKSKRTASVPEVNNADPTDFNVVESELEALHLSRTDNPYLQVLSSQDNLDQAALDDKSSNTVLMSPPESISPTRSYAGGSKDYSLSEIHAHLVRSPPPVSWPMSPRSNGTFSPDSSDMDVDNPLPSSQSIVPSPPTRGYSPYNRSQSEEHILSPCKDLLKSAEFSPVRGTTPELLAISMTAEGGCISPYRDFDIRSERRSGMRGNVGRTASFISTHSSSIRPFTSATTAGGGQVSGGHQQTPSGIGIRNSRHNRSSNVYYTMNYCEDEDLDEDLLSPNRNQMTFTFGSSRSSRRSIGGLSLSPMSMSLTGPPSAPINSGKTGTSSSGFFASWRRSYRSRSKSSSGSAQASSSRKKDAKSMENLLQNERPVPRYSLDYEDELDEESNN